MIEILADSPDDGALIARAIGSDTRVVNNSVRFANGDAHAECRILGCRHPIQAERIVCRRAVPLIFLATERRGAAAPQTQRDFIARRDG